MLIVLYILLGISILAPIYTYAIYPLILMRLPKRVCGKTKDYNPSLSVVIIGGYEEEFNKKAFNVKESDYGNILEIKHTTEIDALNEIKTSEGEVILVTDTKTVFLSDSISNAIRTLSSPLVGCVCGMIRKAPDEGGVFHDGANWMYENKIKALESNIGCLSGANAALYIVKKDLLPAENKTSINLDFLIPTCVTANGFDVLFEPKAVAYEMESRSESDLFMKHVSDGASGYRSIIRFWRMLLPCKGSFVFWSHRVFKWLVPFNMLILLAGCGVLSISQNWALIAFALQVLAYVYLTLYYFFLLKKGNIIPGPLGKLSGFASYFFVLNVAWFMGLFVKK